MQYSVDGFSLSYFTINGSRIIAKKASVRFYSIERQTNDKSFCAVMQYSVDY